MLTIQKTTIFEHNGEAKVELFVSEQPTQEASTEWIQISVMVARQPAKQSVEAVQSLALTEASRLIDLVASAIEQKLSNSR